jgi:Icc protein
VLPGNHDDRRALRSRFGLPGSGADPIRYAADLGAVRLVVLDTTRPGSDPGTLDAGELEWLDQELAAGRDVPTVVAMHHPPLSTGIPAWDDLSLSAADHSALAGVVGRHPDVRRIVGGHVHRAITAELAGRVVVSAPSTYVQLRLGFGSTIELADEPAGFLVHAVVGDRVVTHVQPVEPPRRALTRAGTGS